MLGWEMADEMNQQGLETLLGQNLDHTNAPGGIVGQEILQLQNGTPQEQQRAIHLRTLSNQSERCGGIKVIDAGQMHLYLSYAREHWSQPEENRPVGIILCAGKGGALVRNATDNLPTRFSCRVSHCTARRKMSCD